MNKSAAAVLLVLVACRAASSSEPFGASDTALKGGEASACYPQSVSVNSETGRCTGVVIAPDLVLTAAHCVILGGSKPHGDIELVSAVAAGSASRPANIYVHPQYERCRPGGKTFAAASGNDLAVIQLDKPILPPGAEPARLGEGPPAPGTSLDVIGYGNPDFDRRIGRFRLDAANGSTLDVTGLDAGICGGDSGGAAYRQGSPCNASPPPEVVGIVSSQPLGVERGICEIGTSKVLTNVTTPANRGFIDAVRRGEARKLSDEATPDCCMPGATRACPEGSAEPEVVCQPNGEWPACQPKPVTCRVRFYPGSCAVVTVYSNCCEWRYPWVNECSDGSVAGSGYERGHLVCNSSPGEYE